MAGLGLGLGLLLGLGEGGGGLGWGLGLAGVLLSLPGMGGGHWPHVHTCGICFCAQQVATRHHLPTSIHAAQRYDGVAGLRILKVTAAHVEGGAAGLGWPLHAALSLRRNSLGSGCTLPLFLE